MTSVGGNGSGFISRNNDDPTAEATFWFQIDRPARKRMSSGTKLLQPSDRRCFAK